MKKLLFTLIIIFPCLIWGQDTFESVTSASGVTVNKKVQLPENVTVDGTAFTGTFAGLSITNLLEALNAVDAFILGSPGSGSFDPNLDLTANDANWNWTRLGQNIFRISDTDNRVDVNATLRIGTGGTISGARVSHYYTSSFDTAEYKFRKATGNNGAYISGGTSSAANDVFEIRANGDINITGQYLINEVPIGAGGGDATTVLLNPSIDIDNDGTNEVNVQESVEKLKDVFDSASISDLQTSITTSTEDANDLYKIFNNDTGSDYTYTLRDLGEDDGVIVFKNKSAGSKVTFQTTAGITYETARETGTNINSSLTVDWNGTTKTFSPRIDDSVAFTVTEFNIFPNGNAASNDDVALVDPPWFGSQLVDKSVVASTDPLQGDNFAVRIEEEAATAPTLNGFGRFELTNMELVEHVATIRVRRVQGSGRIAEWRNVDEATAIYDADFDSVPAGEWITATVTFTPTDPDVDMRFFATGQVTSADGDALEISHISIIR